MDRLHPDLKLGAVLLGAVLLLQFGRIEAVFVELLEHHEMGVGLIGTVFAAMSLGSIATVGAAVWVDRRGPHPMMALGAAVAAVTSLLFVAAFAFLPLAWPLAFLHGVGMAGVAGVIVYAVAVKGAVRYPGLLIGAIASVNTLPRFFPPDRTDEWWTVPFVLVGALTTAAAAHLLYWLLPRVFSPRSIADSAQEPSTLGELLGAPGFWRAALPILVAGILITGLGIAASVNIPRLTVDTALEASNTWIEMSILVGALGALVIGVASDRWHPRTLLVSGVVLGITLTVLALALDGWTRAVSGLLLLSLYRVAFGILPWLLLAKLVTVRHFATVGVLGVIAAAIPGVLVPPIIGLTLDLGGANALTYVWQLPFAIALLVVALWVPRQPLVHRPAATPAD